MEPDDHEELELMALLPKPQVQSRRSSLGLVRRSSVGMMRRSSVGQVRPSDGQVRRRSLATSRERIENRFSNGMTSNVRPVITNGAICMHDLISQSEDTHPPSITRTNSTPANAYSQQAANRLNRQHSLDFLLEVSPSLELPVFESPQTDEDAWAAIKEHFKRGHQTDGSVLKSWKLCFKCDLRCTADPVCSCKLPKEKEQIHSNPGFTCSTTNVPEGPDTPSRNLGEFLKTSEGTNNMGPTESVKESTLLTTDSKKTGDSIIAAENGDVMQTGYERETWGKKLDFLLSVIGFAVDLGNVWRFPYICYENGGGAFLLPYLIMLVFAGLPLFYMELALGQYQKCGCITVWSRICPMFKGIGFGICLIATFVAWYYNTIMAWSMYYLFQSMRSEVPWKYCDNDWNTPNCTYPGSNNTGNWTVSAAKEFYIRGVLELQRSNGIEHLGNVKWSLALCLFAVFIIVYFALWKGIKSSGKAVWITATVPYVILIILLVHGLTLEGSAEGILYYVTPKWSKLKDPTVWTAAASQIFFSLGPGFGVLLALSSYNKFHNNCYRDALLTSSVNCLTSILAGFVVFAVLGYMSHTLKQPIDKVAVEGPGLVFVVYPQAIATMKGSPFFAIIFFIMLITLGLDSTFGGLESLITGICDEFPRFLGRKRELFVLGLMIYCFMGALCTTTYGGAYVVWLFDTYGAPISLLFIVFLESIAVSWFYGVFRFSGDIEKMLGFRPGWYWVVCWVAICPCFLFVLFIMSLVYTRPLVYEGYAYPPWSIAVGWCITCSSVVCVPGYMVYKYISTPGTMAERLRAMIVPEEAPDHAGHELSTTPAYL